MAYIQGSCKLGFIEPNLTLTFRCRHVKFYFQMSDLARFFFLIPLYLSSVAVCCSKCILLSSSSCLTRPRRKIQGGMLQGGREKEEEEGSNRDGGRGPLFRNSAGLECLCYTTSVHHWCQQKVGPRVSATAILSPHKFSTVLPTGTKPPSMEKMWRATLKDTHKWIFLYKKRERERDYILFIDYTVWVGKDLGVVSA